MSRCTACTFVSLAFLGCISASPPKPHEHGPHWTYEGKEGPEHWSELDPSFKTCSLGHLQSPIDIPATAIKAEPLDSIRFDYRSIPLHVTDNGHTEMVTYAPGSTIRIGAAELELQQIHFHRPSEERVDGQPFPLVAHLVHKSEGGKLAVVAVLFREGAENPALAAVFGHLPSAQDEEQSPAGVTIDASTLLPPKTSYWTFEGSLTTPPCTEGVTWYVLREPATASAEQIAAFAGHYPHDARPVQPLGGREIRASE